VIRARQRQEKGRKWGRGKKQKTKNKNFQYKAARELGQNILSVLAFALAAKY
jgi:hypothetical protein